MTIRFHLSLEVTAIVVNLVFSCAKIHRNFGSQLIAAIVCFLRIVIGIGH